MKKIGVLGGTYNPVHKGHIMLANYCKRELNLDEIILIPTFIPPHKASFDLADENHRLNMCRLACKNLKGFSVSDIEIKRGGKSFTYQTLTSLKEQFKDDELYLIMGADIFVTLHEWKNPRIIFELATMVAIPRDSSDSKMLESYYVNTIKPMGADAIILSSPVLSVSSTFIRTNINKKNVVDSLLDRNVYDYIEKNKLYRV